MNLLSDFFSIPNYMKYIIFNEKSNFNLLLS